jgi:hypothetical protein
MLTSTRRICAPFTPGEAPAVSESFRFGEPPMNEKLFRTFDDFYPFYLGEHTNRTCRRLHFTGTSIAVALLFAAVVTQRWWLIAVAFAQGYAFAWVGHFFFEHNKPATFKYPWFSLMGDWRLWWDILNGKVRI